MPFNYFISVKFLKEETTLHENVDDKLVKIAIKEAQEITIRDVLGSSLYNLIQSQLPSSLTSANITLMDSYIIPCLKYYTLAEIITNLQYKLANSSIMTRDAQGGRTVGLSDIGILKGEYNAKGEYYKERLINYICLNIALYPTYNTGVQEINPKTKNFTGNIYFLNDYENTQFEKIRIIT